MGFFPYAVGTAGNGGFPAGALFLGRNRGKNTKGKEVPPPWNPILWWRNGGRWLGRYGPGLRPPRPTPHGPPTGSGGREKWFVDGRRKRETKRFLSAFSQRVPPHVPSPPSRWAGRYGPFAGRAAGQVLRQKYSLPLHNPTREGGPGGGTSSPGGSFPHFFPRNGAPAGQAKVPARSNGAGEEPHNTPRAHPPPGMGIDFSDHNLYNVSQPNSCCGRGEPR